MFFPTAASFIGVRGGVFVFTLLVVSRSCVKRVPADDLVGVPPPSVSSSEVFVGPLVACLLVLVTDEANGLTPPVLGVFRGVFVGCFVVLVTDEGTGLMPPVLGVFDGTLIGCLFSLTTAEGNGFTPPVLGVLEGARLLGREICSISLGRGGALGAGREGLGGGVFCLAVGRFGGAGLRPPPVFGGADGRPTGLRVVLLGLLAIYIFLSTTK